MHLDAVAAALSRASRAAVSSSSRPTPRPRAASLTQKYVMRQKSPGKASCTMKCRPMKPCTPPSRLARPAGARPDARRCARSCRRKILRAGIAQFAQQCGDRRGVLDFPVPDAHGPISKNADDMTPACPPHDRRRAARTPLRRRRHARVMWRTMPDSRLCKPKPERRPGHGGASLRRRPCAARACRSAVWPRPARRPASARIRRAPNPAGPCWRRSAS